LITGWHLVQDTHVPVSDDTDIASAILDALDDLLLSLQLQEIGADHYRVPSDTARLFDRVYGGQLLAQALIGAGATVEGTAPQSLHAAFVKGGVPGRPIDVVVDRVRDGRTMASRQMTVLQDGDPLLVGFASFHENSEWPDVTPAAPGAPPPEDTPRLQDWVWQLPPELAEGARHWVDRPPPLELRLTELPAFLSGGTASTPRSHWMRTPRLVEGDQLLQAALLAYGSDFFLMDMIFRAHPSELGPGSANGLSVDHAIWLHRPVRFDDWHLHTQEAVAIFGDRGLARGSIHDVDGRLVATVMQEVLVRPGSIR
jgi:acyl-CoA thioesterase II